VTEFTAGVARPPYHLRMTAVDGLFLAGAALLVVSGVAKLRSGEPTRRALHGAGLPGPAWAVGLLGATEVVVGASGLVTEGRPAAVATAVLYTGFAAFVVLARRRGGSEASCGCFGRQEAPPGAAHLMTTLALVVVAVLQAASPGPGLVTELARSPLQTTVLAGYAAIVTWLVYLVLAVVPRVGETVTEG
jgi:uncharacterized membrane protein YphA (DoxX/SURF4 family)